MDELTRKINMWRIALEKRNANMGVMQVFDSMLVFIGEQQRENEQLKKDVAFYYEAYLKSQENEFDA